MTTGGAGLDVARPAGRRRGGPWRTARWLLALAVLGAVLAVGIALGMALHDNPRPTGPQTVEHTVELAP